MLTYSDLYTMITVAFLAGLFVGYCWGFAMEAWNWRCQGRQPKGIVSRLVQGGRLWSGSHYYRVTRE